MCDACLVLLQILAPQKDGKVPGNVQVRLDTLILVETHSGLFS